MSRKKTINVSDLAWFAENQDEFLKYKGRAMNKSAVKFGNKFHNKMNKASLGVLGWIIVLAFLGSAGYLFFLSSQ